VTFGGYLGGGGELTFGHDAGNFFATLRIGYGIGGGVSWSPDGSIPGNPSFDRNSDGWVMSASAQGGGSLVGFLNATAEYGLATNFDSDISEQYGDRNVSFGLAGEQGIRGHLSGGFQFTHYFARDDFYTNEGTCRL
jgi:hypothetical protein